MPYRFPRKKLRPTDVPHPREFNQAWQPLAELASGNLDAHNFDGALTSFSVVANPHAFYKPYYVEVESNPGWGNPAAYTAPTVAGLPASAHFVGQTANWGAVTSMEIECATGVSNLWIVFWCTYALHQFVAGATSPIFHNAEIGVSSGILRSAGLQLALEVDGKILPDSITGFTEDWKREFACAKPEYQRDASTFWSSGTPDPSSNFPGPVLQHSAYVQGIGPAVGAVRLVCNANVSPGTHTVRVVARTLQEYLPGLNVYYSAPAIGLAIHHRKLFVLDCPVFPASAPTRNAVDIPPIVDGMTLTTAGLNSARHDALVDELNDIEKGNVARGAFLNGHLPATMLDKSTTTLSPASPQTIHCLYPGFSVNTIAGTKATGATGWWWLDDTATGDRIRSDDDAYRGAGTWDVSGGDKYFIILGNLQVHGILGQTAARSPGHFFSGALAYKITGGAVDVLGSTEAYANNHIDAWYYANNNANIDRSVEIDVPFFHVLNYSTLNGGAAPAFNAIDYFGIVGSGFSLAVVTEGPDVNYQRGNISVLELRG